jgi:hypothetical protein
MKPVLSKIIHTDQKGFVAGRNISENNRMLDDIIEFVDNETNCDQSLNKTTTKKSHYSGSYKIKYDNRI